MYLLPEKKKLQNYECIKPIYFLFSFIC
uniref:Uncharacterized protein n=1 Tax=Anguilla anguilla TaxID=7936 RepID=A0A0E9UME1_ANGAN